MGTQAAGAPRWAGGAPTSSPGGASNPSEKRRPAVRMGPSRLPEPHEVAQQQLRGALLCAALGFTFCEAHAQIQTVPGMPPAIDPQNLYSETTSDKMSPALAGHRELVYGPH